MMMKNPPFPTYISGYQGRVCGGSRRVYRIGYQGRVCGGSRRVYRIGYQGRVVVEVEGFIG
jgi:hypothetical protein